VLARYFAGVFGLAYVAVAVIGFIPPLSPRLVDTGDDYIIDMSLREVFGLFPVNVLHNLAHLLFGIGGLLAYVGVFEPRRFARALAFFYATLSIFGLIPGLDTVFGLLPIHGHDIWLHALSGAVAAYFGWWARDPSVVPAPQPRQV
jgi:hypothetical protein